MLVSVIIRTADKNPTAYVYTSVKPLPLTPELFERVPYEMGKV